MKFLGNEAFTRIFLRNFSAAGPIGLNTVIVFSKNK